MKKNQKINPKGSELDHPLRYCNVSLQEFVNDYGVVDIMDEAKIRSEIYQSKKRWFFIGYYAENGECFPMEVRP